LLEDYYYRQKVNRQFPVPSGLHYVDHIWFGWVQPLNGCSHCGLQLLHFVLFTLKVTFCQILFFTFP